MLHLSLIVFFSLQSFPVYGELRKILDLSWEYSNETIFWGTIEPFHYTKKVAQNHTTKGYWYAMNEFCLGEHGGTHLDAPYHFNEYGWKVNEIPIERFVAKGAVIDLGSKVTKDGPNTKLEPGDLVNWEGVNGPFENGTVLLVRFGWSKFWPNRTMYMGTENGGNPTFPGISEAAAEWIVKSDKFYGVGIDTASVDPGTSSDLHSHRILSSKQMYNLENVKLVEDLPTKGFSLVVLPMKLKDGTGGPVRILAMPKNALN